MTEDITYCTKQNCGYLRCERNLKHIKLPIPHSYAKLEGTEFCYKNREDVGGIVYQQDYDRGESHWKKYKHINRNAAAKHILQNVHVWNMKKDVCGIQTMKLVIPAEKGKCWMERKNAGIVL